MIVDGWKVPDDLLASVTARCVQSETPFTFSNVVGWLHTIGAAAYPRLPKRADPIADRLIQRLRKAGAIRWTGRQWEPVREERGA